MKSPVFILVIVDCPRMGTGRNKKQTNDTGR